MPEAPDWLAMFRPDMPLLEMFVRGTVMYLAMLIMLRLTPNRESGNFAHTNLLVLVLIADAAQNGMAADYQSVTNGLVLVATLLFWSMAVEWASFHFPWVRRLVQSPPVRVVRNGRPVHRAMRSEMLTMEELESQLRQQGITDLAEVREAWLEPDGQLSVLRRDGGETPAARRPPA